MAVSKSAKRKELRRQDEARKAEKKKARLGADYKEPSKHPAKSGGKGKKKGR